MELRNKSATYEYFIEEKYEAGMILTGTEVKSLRNGTVSFTDSYCLLNNNELFIKGLHISPCGPGSYANAPATRERKLLLTKKEIQKIQQKLRDKGLTIIPLRIFFNDRGYAKIQIGIARGKKLHDKRESIKQREADREIKRFVK